MNQPPIPYRDDNGISFGEKATRGRSGVAKSLWLFWALLGPGIITQLANNDAGGTISYAMTGGGVRHKLVSPVSAENLISGKGLGSDVVQSRVGAAARGMRLTDLKVAVRSSAQNTESDRNEPCRRALNELVQ